MIEANKALVQRWFDEVWNKGNADAVDELLAPDGKAHGFPEPTAYLTGPAGFKPAHSAFLATFSKIHMAVERVVAEGDTVAVQWNATLTHTGDGLGFAPTGLTVTVPGSSFAIIKDGKMAEAWNYMDFTRVINGLQAASLKA